MKERPNKPFEQINEISKKIEREINNLYINFSKKYGLKIETSKKLANFETSKSLESLKKEVQKLKKSGELKKEINTEKLLLDLKKLKKQIKQLSQKERQILKQQIENKKFFPTIKYDLAEIIKDKNFKIYQKITNPKVPIDYLLSTGLGIGNSIYKTGIGIGKLTIDFVKLLTFQVSIKNIKEQFKRV